LIDIFDPIQRWFKIHKLLDSKIDISDIPCDECGGEGVCEYGRGDEVREYACEKCNPNGNEPDEDAEYERHRDMITEKELDQLEAVGEETAGEAKD
jgi:hypothetical protein